MSDTNTDTAIPNMSDLVVAKMQPYTAAMSAFFRREVEKYRQIDSDRDDLFLALEQLIINNTNMITETVNHYLETKDQNRVLVEEINLAKIRITELETKVGILETAVAGLETRVVDLEESTNTSSP